VKYLAVIRLILMLANKFMGRLSDKEQQEIGKDRAIKSSLANMLVQIKTGKQIDAASEHYDDTDVDRILQDSFRD
jgi:hypothetical protein